MKHLQGLSSQIAKSFLAENKAQIETVLESQSPYVKTLYQEYCEWAKKGGSIKELGLDLSNPTHIEFITMMDNLKHTVRETYGIYNIKDNTLIGYTFERLPRKGFYHKMIGTNIKIVTS